MSVTLTSENKLEISGPHVEEEAEVLEEESETETELDISDSSDSE